MATEEGVTCISVMTGASFAAKQYCLGKVNTSGLLIVGTAGASCIGIVQNKPASGEVASVAIYGKAIGLYGGSVTAGDDLASDASGKLVTAVAGDHIVAKALESGSANEQHSVVLSCQGIGSYPASEQGDVLYSNGSTFVVLHHGTADQIFCTGGHGANPSWKTATITGWVWFYTLLADIADGDLVTEWVPGFAGTLTDFRAVVEKAATTAAKGSTLNLEVETTDVTGSNLVLTSANCTPKGAQVACAGITAGNTFTSTQKISIEASSTTTFSEGSIWMGIKYTQVPVMS